ncbi:hypothetical protein GO755_38985 [Spirosoma sp. HMF4905]|uniref:Uncharacterized protein n=1 Tax=Spirosoma arboris TaxID=2682092 RepID=A0A7K1SQH8_9BACT|nr:hypothetical protein [Spirosoma arboris]MVM36064.1 hypothetical protein [Spirosoma arboris]
MSTQDRVKAALPLALQFVVFSQRLKEIETSYPDVPRNIFRSVDEAKAFDKECADYDQAVKTLDDEASRLKATIKKMEEWGPDDEPRTLSTLLSGYDNEPPIVVVVTAKDRNFKVFENEGFLAYKDWS